MQQTPFLALKYLRNVNWFVAMKFISVQSTSFTFCNSRAIEVVDFGQSHDSAELKNKKLRKSFHSKFFVMAHLLLPDFCLEILADCKNYIERRNSVPQMAVFEFMKENCTHYAYTQWEKVTKPFIICCKIGWLGGQFLHFQMAYRIVWSKRN